MTTFEIPTLLARLGPVSCLRLPFWVAFSFLPLPNISFASSSFFLRWRSAYEISLRLPKPRDVAACLPELSRQRRGSKLCQEPFLDNVKGNFGLFGACCTNHDTTHNRLLQKVIGRELELSQ